MQAQSPRPTIIVKVGGALIEERGAVNYLWEFVAEQRKTHELVVVHGGGPQATRLAERLGHTPRIIHGRRITTDIDREIAMWTFPGTINTLLVAAAGRAGVNAAGLSGVDGRTIEVIRRPPRIIDGETVDFGWVGEIQRINTKLLGALLTANIVPVIASLGVGPAGQVYNVNADTIAVAVAKEFKAEQLHLITESGGVCTNPDDAASCLATCSPATLRTGASEGWINNGMRPKLETALSAAVDIPFVRVVGLRQLSKPDTGTRILATDPQPA